MFLLHKQTYLFEVRLSMAISNIFFIPDETINQMLIILFVNVFCFISNLNNYDRHRIESVFCCCCYFYYEI